MNEDNLVVSEQHNKVRVLILNRPERRNALAISLLESLKSALKAANADSETHIIVLRGAGPSFCAGKDLKDHQVSGKDQKSVQKEVGLFHDVSREIMFGEKVVIAAVHGWAAGGGLELMINCDLVILDENARMFFPEMSLGLFVTCGVTALLPRLIGLSQTKALMMSGDKFDAQHALRLGLAWQVLPSDEFEQKVIEKAEKMAAMPQNSLRQLKKVMMTGLRDEVEAALKIEAEIAQQTALDPESQKLARSKLSPD
ncbi:MAG: enoyl-CoA hydratase/isomerase family protein [Gammaproteobacteria bacterium]|nr:enoyl-CoA hydratase/isomerase family protein [Gammaproteobacteria bacterium]